jgi:apolipoprotein N-acyltransferase
MFESVEDRTSSGNRGRQSTSRTRRLTETARSSLLAGALAALPETVILSWGWRRRAIAFFAGAIGAFALPPFSAFAAMVVPMTVAVWLIDGSLAAIRPAVLARPKAAFGAGWWLGFGYFLVGLWWIGAACLVDGLKFVWALPLGVLVLPAALAVFPALGFSLAALLWPPGPRRVFALALGLGLSEWARCLAFTGFPWNDFGMALGSNLTLAEIASVVGQHGLTFIAIAVFAAPATLWPAGQRRAAPAATIVASLALLGIAAFGAYRLSAPPSATVPNVRLRLVQPDISQGASFSPENKDAIVRRYLELTGSDGGLEREDNRITHVIWPESAFPFILSRDPQALGDIASMLGSNAVLLTGAARLEMRPGNDPKYYNSIQVIDRGGLRRERYDKQHLVPFGEYVPFGSFLEKAGVTQFVQAPGGFTAGTGRRTLNAPGLPTATPLICYEAIFPVEIGDALSQAERPGWLLNVTDDAWFGVTPGPYQHYAQARLRAIELGLPLVRVANSGISAIVDGFGREVSATPLGAQDVVDGGLPEPLPPTWQSRFGSATAAGVGLTLLLLTFRGRKRG